MKMFLEACKKTCARKLILRERANGKSSVHSLRQVSWSLPNEVTQIKCYLDDLLKNALECISQRLGQRHQSARDPWGI
jgi:hypothetical protein